MVQRTPLTNQQRTFLRVAARQLEIGHILLNLENAAERTGRRRPAPVKAAPQPKARRQPPACPSEYRYRMHRKAGEDCAVCAPYMRTKWAATRAAHPEWLQRGEANRAERRRAEVDRQQRLADKPADMAARKAAVMAQFAEDAA